MEQILYFENRLVLKRTSSNSIFIFNGCDAWFRPLFKMTSSINFSIFPFLDCAFKDVLQIYHTYLIIDSFKILVLKSEYLCGWSCQWSFVQIHISPKVLHRLFEILRMWHSTILAFSQQIEERCVKFKPISEEFSEKNVFEQTLIYNFNYINLQKYYI